MKNDLYAKLYIFLLKHNHQKRVQQHIFETNKSRYDDRENTACPLHSCVTVDFWNVLRSSSNYA